MNIPNKVGERFLWTAEDGLWWKIYFTNLSGHFQKVDLERFNKVKGQYIIHGDHRYPDKLREFARSMLVFHEEFFAAKVSKFARDGELVCLLPTYDDTYALFVKERAKFFNLLCWKFKTAGESEIDEEKEAKKKWMLHVMNVAASLEYDRKEYF